MLTFQIRVHLLVSICLCLLHPGHMQKTCNIYTCPSSLRHLLKRVWTMHSHLNNLIGQKK
jgi:hypothetical protein